ncbi:hypothetical protein N8T08_010246 [Aspergillus melleus]|uniref:Uncharacterized protein n=1 Tax=Aspergillus melleus TaxID=138277 RepID=A0ACC3AS66_9EURO|nr:hypothetical protein N8T08_010246 [Aspergillus melleus]
MDSPINGFPTERDDQTAEPSTIDSMNGMTGDPTQSAEVFGSSSAGAFMRQVQAAMNVKQGAPGVSAQGSVARMTKHSAEDVPLSDAEEAELAILPPKELAGSLIQAYWQFEWPLYPTIDRRNITAVSSKKSTTSRTWDAAMHVLESYSVIADSAKRRKAALEVLSECLSLGKTDNIWLWESFTEMCRLLGESSGVPSFDSDDFLWLG